MASRRCTSMLLFSLTAALLFQTLVTEVACSRNLASVEDDKAYSSGSHKPSGGSKGKGKDCPKGSGSGSGTSSPPKGSSFPPYGSGSGSGSPPKGSGSPPKGSGSPPYGSGSGSGSPPYGSGSGSGTPPGDSGAGTPYLPGVPMPPSIWLPSPGIPGIITGSCDYWRTHPQSIWAICGYWNTIGRMLGLSPPSSPNLSLLDALRNTRTDGLGDLYREGTAAFLNSLANQKFIFSSSQVRNAFASALVSDQAAAEQAQIFKRANEGRL